MKNLYPIQVIDFRFQIDHITPRKYNYLKNFLKILIMKIYLLS